MHMISSASYSLARPTVNAMIVKQRPRAIGTFDLRDHWHASTCTYREA